MDLLLLFIVGIVISEYTEKRSKFINIVNSVAFIIFSVLVFYGSNNPVIMYAARNQLGDMGYNTLHNALHYTFLIGNIKYSSYIGLVIFLSLVMIVAATCFTVKVVRKIIKLVKSRKPEKIIEKKYKFSLIKNENSFNKLYLVFGEFLS